MCGSYCDLWLIIWCLPVQISRKLGWKKSSWNHHSSMGCECSKQAVEPLCQNAYPYIYLLINIIPKLRILWTIERLKNNSLKFIELKSLDGKYENQIEKQRTKHWGLTIHLLAVCWRRDQKRFSRRNNKKCKTNFLKPKKVLEKDFLKCLLMPSYLIQSMLANYFSAYVSGISIAILLLKTIVYMITCCFYVFVKVAYYLYVLK